jgi:hypothetical protein
MDDEILEREIYRFIATGECPRILDCRANIGLSVSFIRRREHLGMDIQVKVIAFRT